MGSGPTGSPLVVALDGTPLLGVPTGVGVFCREATGALASLDELDVRVFAISWRRRHMLGEAIPVGARRVGRAMPARPLHLAWRHGEVPPVEWFIGATDVVHGTNFVVPPACQAARVVTVHDLTTVRFPDMCDGPTLRFPSLVRRAVAHGAWVHTPSKYVAEEVVELFDVDPKRVRAVHHGVPMHRQEPLQGMGDGQAPPVPGGLPEGCSRYVLAVGTAEPRKDLPGLVKAFDSVAAHLRDVALVLAGQRGWGSAVLDEAIGLSRSRGRIIATGYVEDLGRLLEGATVLAYPSLYEGFGLPTLEAMAVGVPVVTTSAGALPEVVGDAAVVVAPGDTDALAGALERVLEDEPVRLELIDRGLKRAILFNWETCAHGLVDLYRDAVAEKR